MLGSKHFFKSILKREEERGRREERRERDIAQLPSVGAQGSGWNPQPRYVAQLGITPTAFWCMEPCFNQLGNPARARQSLLSKLLSLKYNGVPW